MCEANSASDQVERAAPQRKNREKTELVHKAEFGLAELAMRNLFAIAEVIFHEVLLLIIMSYHFLYI